MAIPVVPIISAVTPLVLGALDLYRRRSEAKTASSAVVNADPQDLPRLAEALERRMQALDESDLEQARLISELSKNVEALARVVEAQSQVVQNQSRQLQRWIWGAAATSALALILAIWSLV